MRSTRKSSGAAETTPEQRRDQIVSILAAGLVRVVRGSEAALYTTGNRPVSIPPVAPAVTTTGGWGEVDACALASMHDKELSESGEIGLELSGETRLSVVAG